MDEVKKTELEGLRHCLDKSSDIPLYMQLAQALERMIDEQAFSPGARLPNTTELKQAAGVHVGTVAKAMGLLVEKNLVVRRRRAGTFVAERASSTRGNIGFYYLHEREPYTLEQVEALQLLLDQHQLDVKLIPFQKGFYGQTDIVQDIHERNLTGGVFTVLKSQACRDAMKSLEAVKFPHVRLGNPYFQHELQSPLVAGCDEAHIDHVFRSLRELGHKHIGLLGLNTSSALYTLCQRELCKAEDYRERWHMMLGFDNPLQLSSEQAIRPVVRTYLSNNPELTAVIVWNPTVAARLIEEANELGYAVPEKLSVVCLRDGEQSGIPTPCNAYTLDRRRMGEIAGEKLLAMIRRDAYVSSTYLSWSYVDRHTVASTGAIVRTSLPEALALTE